MFDFWVTVLHFVLVSGLIAMAVWVRKRSLEPDDAHPPRNVQPAGKDGIAPTTQSTGTLAGDRANADHHRHPPESPPHPPS
jgi:hypothetical protein